MRSIADEANLYDQRIRTLTRAISDLEGQAFGAHFRFASFQLGLHHSCEGGWRECVGFGMYTPGTDEFALELNVVIAPVVAKYAAKLRQHLANECTKLGAAALKNPTGR